jgi:hypothetical protein
MEIKQPILKRFPPCDRWVEIDSDGRTVYPTLTAALEYMFQKTRCKQYFLDAGEGRVYIIKQEADPEPEIPTFSIYGDH